MSRIKMKIKQKLDWKRLAFILEINGETSLEELTDIFNRMFKNGKTKREVARIIACYSRYGFESRSLKPKSNKHYKFNGDLSEIHRRTTQRWEEKFNSL